MRRGLFIGRFQPFHLGHLKVVEHILASQQEVVIGVGSAQYSHTLDNPFTAGERIEIISRTLKQSVGLDRVFIVPIPDIGEHRLWVSRVISFCPEFQTVYSNNSLVQILFQEAGFRVESVPFFDRDKMMGREIRKLISTGGDWRSRLHPEAVKYLERIGAEKRLSAIITNDF
ncbi:MAG: nicotinamide-nucleotide adenylyltransferase [Candidatus Caldarchaeum sp.]|nr:nicotinamide-nucleotide adenylyltransferase [Candidatus Caldarchaeum sp.]